MQERRRAKRISQPIRAEISLPDAEGRVKTCTRDISSCGAYFPHDGPSPSPNTKVAIKLYFNRDQAYVETVGNVVRTQHNGFSVNFTSFALLPLTGAPVAPSA